MPSGMQVNELIILGLTWHRVHLSVNETTESGGKNSPVAFGLPRSKASPDTEKEDFFLFKARSLQNACFSLLRKEYSF